MNMKFFVCEHGVPGVLEINFNGGFKRDMEFFSSTTKNLLLLSKC